MTIFKVNGRKVYSAHLTDFTRLSRSRYSVIRNATVYRIEGGKYAGGTSHEWFIECAEWTKPILCTSLTDALRLLDRM